MHKLLAPALALALLGGAPAVSAAPFAAFGSETTHSSTASSVHITAGYSFTPTEELTVLELGVFDSDLDGLLDPHQVGLWTSSGDLLASVTVPAGTSATLTDAYRYVSISPLALAQGETYVLGAEIGPIPGNASNDTILNAVNATNGVFDPRLGSIAARANGTDQGFGFPEFSAALVSAVPNFRAVPEPSTATLLGFACVAIAAMRRRERG